MKKASPEAITRILALSCCGISAREIGVRTGGIGQSTVKRHLLSNGIRSDFPRGTKRILGHGNLWRGGVSRKSGYVYVHRPLNLRNNQVYVPQHVAIMEEIVGRAIGTDEIVHHINEVRDDNRPENLLLVTKAEHVRIHRKGQPAPRRSIARAGR